MTRHRKVVLRADGGPDIGMGHFVRTLALGEMLQDDFYCIYATKSPTDQQKKEIYQVCEELIELPDDNSHFNTFLKHLKGDEIVVLDNYYFDTEYQKKIKKIGSKLVCIDDMHDKHYVADIVINHAEGLHEEKFSIEDYTYLCLGYKYSLLRKPFFEQLQENYEKEFDILIAIGGVDPYNITKKIVNIIYDYNSNLSTAILSGNANIGRTKGNEFDNLQRFENQTAEEIYRLMKRSKVGIFPASTISIEATAARLPFFVGYFVENQKNIYNGIVSNKTGMPLESFHSLTYKKLVGNISYVYNSEENIFEEIKKKQEQYLDKRSPRRLSQIFKRL